MEILIVVSSLAVTKSAVQLSRQAIKNWFESRLKFVASIPSTEDAGVLIHVHPFQFQWQLTPLSGSVLHNIG